MPISPISPVTALSGINPVGSTAPVAAASGSGDGGFAASLAGAVNGLQQAQSTSDQLNVQAVTGNLNDIQDATVAAARAATQVQLFATVKNQAVSAFNSIMGMQA